MVVVHLKAGKLLNRREMTVTMKKITVPLKEEAINQLTQLQKILAEEYNATRVTQGFVIGLALKKFFEQKTEKNKG